MKHMKLFCPPAQSALSMAADWIFFLRQCDAALRTRQCLIRLCKSGLVVAGGILGASPALAQATADLDAVDRAVAQFAAAAQGQRGGAVMPVDRRLRLTSCQVPLALSWHGARRESVEVVCPMPGGWRIYVPIQGAGAATAKTDAISRGDAVSVIVSGDGFAVSQGGEALENGPLGGWIKIRMLSPGAPILRAKVLRPGAVGIGLP